MGEEFGAALGRRLVVVALPRADAALRGALHAFVAARDGAERDAYGRVALRAGRILLAILAVLFFGWLWGIDLFDMAAGGIGERVLAPPVDVGLTLLVAYVGGELAKTTIDRRLALEQGTPVSIHPAAAAAYRHDDLADGQELELGAVVLRAIHTPGHRPEHTCLAVTAPDRADEPSLAGRRPAQPGGGASASPTGSLGSSPRTYGRASSTTVSASMSSREAYLPSYIATAWLR